MGAALVAQSKPDGYTLFFSGTSMLIAPEAVDAALARRRPDFGDM